MGRVGVEVIMRPLQLKTRRKGRCGVHGVRVSSRRVVTVIWFSPDGNSVRRERARLVETVRANRMLPSRRRRRKTAPGRLNKAKDGQEWKGVDGSNENVDKNMHRKRSGPVEAGAPGMKVKVKVVFWGKCLLSFLLGHGRRKKLRTEVHCLSARSWEP